MRAFMAATAITLCLTTSLAKAEAPAAPAQPKPVAMPWTEENKADFFCHAFLAHFVDALLEKKQPELAAKVASAEGYYMGRIRGRVGSEWFVTPEQLWQITHTHTNEKTGDLADMCMAPYDHTVQAMISREKHDAH